LLCYVIDSWCGIDSLSLPMWSIGHSSSLFTLWCVWWWLTSIVTSHLLIWCLIWSLVVTSELFGCLTSSFLHPPCHSRLWFIVSSVVMVGMVGYSQCGGGTDLPSRWWWVFTLIITLLVCLPYVVWSSIWMSSVLLVSIGCDISTFLPLPSSSTSVGT